ncbi:MAG: glycine zipper 2TM domain-containing protein, partial [Lysobacter sp.]
MNRLLVSTLALGLAAATGIASAQTYGQPYGSSYRQQGYYGQPSPDRYGQSRGSQYDYARVIRVDPVFGSGYASGYGNQQVNGQRCYERPTYVSGNDPYGSGYYRNDGYRNDGYRNAGYRNDGYAQDGYYDPYGNSRTGGSQAGSTIATVLGGVVGAVIGSQVGGGSARYATSAIGSMVGGVAGRQIYEQSRRQRDRTGTVRVCDPVRVDDRYSSSGYGSSNGYVSNDRAVSAYDVTYEYAGRSYTTRTSYHPGDRI